MFTRKQFIDLYYPVALKVTQGTGIFPETLMAQAIVESQDSVKGVYYVGASLNAQRANNYFGIKKGVGWTGKTIVLPTSKDSTSYSTFRKYDSIEDSFKDYVNFLKKNPRYTTAGVFKATSYPEQIIKIAKGGYAESSQYADLITKVANSVSKTINKTIIKPIKDNKGITGSLLAVFFLTIYLIKRHK